MDQTGQKSSLKLWLVVGALVVVGLVVAGAVFIMSGAGTKKEATATNTTTSESEVASTEKVKQDLSTLETSMKQATKDQNAAKAVLKDGDNQIKVGN